MDRRSKAVLALAVVTALALLVPVGVLAKGRPVVETTNNLSFPAIAVDGFAINTLTTPSFTVPYAGAYPGLTAEEIAALQATGPWYAQKVTGNAWQADFATAQAPTAVSWVDWGDNIESVSPVIRRPFRLEVVLFQDLLPEAAMTGYTMALLEYPSSPDEVQGTNTTTYESLRATVISTKPMLIIQSLGASVPSLTWDVALSRWVLADGSVPAVTPVGFAPELNVAGKYIYGASTGGWKPTVAGWYRITFYVPTDSNVSLATAQVLPPVPESEVLAADEGGGATPVVDGTLNLTYVDVQVLGRTR